MLPLPSVRVCIYPPGAHNNYANEVRGSCSVYLRWGWAAARRRPRAALGLAGPRAAPRGFCAPAVCLLAFSTCHVMGW